MWWQVLILGTVTCAVTNAILHETTVNATNPLQDCPATPGVVCSDVYTYHQTGGDTPGDNIRTVHRCGCSGGCPSSENNTVYDSQRHKLRLCTLPSQWVDCANRQASRVLHVSDPAFNFVTYITIQCLCPRHRSPIIVGSSGRLSHYDTATTFFRNGFHNGHPTHQYTCRRRRRMRVRGRNRSRGRRRNSRRRNNGRR